MDSDVLEQLVGISDTIRDAADRPALERALLTACTAFGFDNFLLSCRKSRKRDLVIDPTVAVLPDAFCDEYDRLNIADVDPFLLKVAHGDRPVRWTIPERQPDEAHREYYDFMRSTPMRVVLSIPFSRRAGTTSAFAVMSRREIAHAPAVAGALHVVANAAELKAELLGLVPDEAPTFASLSGRQAEILKWIAAGKSNTDIAVIMDLGERAVRFHVSEILRKLAVASRSQAAALWRARES